MGPRRRRRDIGRLLRAQIGEPAVDPAFTRQLAARAATTGPAPRRRSRVAIAVVAVLAPILVVGSLGVAYGTGLVHAPWHPERRSCSRAQAVHADTLAHAEPPADPVCDPGPVVADVGPAAERRADRDACQPLKRHRVADDHDEPAAEHVTEAVEVTQTDQGPEADQDPGAPEDAQGPEDASSRLRRDEQRCRARGVQTMTP